MITLITACVCADGPRNQAGDKPGVFVSVRSRVINKDMNQKDALKKKAT